MKWIIVSILFLLSSILPLYAVTPDILSSSPEKSGILAVIEKINTEQNTNAQIVGELAYETEIKDENVRKIQRINELFEQIKDNILSLENPAFFSTGQISDDVKNIISDTNLSLKKDLSELSLLLSSDTNKNVFLLKTYNEQKIQSLINDTETKLQKENDETIQKIASLQTNLSQSDEEIKKLHLTLRSVIKDTVFKIFFFFLSLSFFIFGGRYVKNFIKKRESFRDEKKTVLLSITKWIVNTAIIIIIIVFFFSEFLSVLPFLAILGTAFGFAIRDIIASFIAWFVIGLKDNIYKIGDVIELDEGKVSGRVVKISPLVTHIQELGMSGPNGYYMTFPNKKIFESPIRNTWKMNGWVYISFDFFLLTESSLKLSKALLLQVMQEVTSDEKFKSPLGQKGFLKRFGHTDTVLIPQVFLETRPQGILLRGKVLVYWPERHEIRSRIVEEFIEKAAMREEIKLKVVDNI